MSTASTGQGIDEAIGRVAEVVMFENWLRFYFISEHGGKLLIKLTPKTMEQLRTRYPSLYGLAEDLNESEVDHQTSLRSVCLFVAREIGGIRLHEDTVAKVFDNPRFHLELQVFSQWVQGHEEQLDEHFREFSDWMKEYQAWKHNPEVQKFIKTLSEGLPLGSMHTSQTVQ